MKRLITLILSVLFILSFAGCSGSGASYYGNWSVGDKLSDAPLGNFNEEDLPMITGTSLSFSKDSASCFGDDISSLGQTVSNPEYITMNMSKSDFESMMGETFDMIGRKGGSITQVVVIKDEDRNNGIVFYVIDDNTLLANSLGTFFILSRQ